MTGIRDIADGLWTWRSDHPDWDRTSEWAPPVTSTVVVSHGEPVHDRRAFERALSRPPFAGQ